MTARHRRLSHLAVVTAALVAASTGCSTTGLSFVADDSLSITSPADGATVSLPLTVHWEVEEGREAPRYAVFVDRTPMRSGDQVRDVVDADLCRGVPGCPDATLLQGLGVYVTSGTSVEIAAVVARRDRRVGAHEIRVVRLDPRDRRISESSAAVRFFVGGAEPTKAAAPTGQRTAP